MLKGINYAYHFDYIKKYQSWKAWSEKNLTRRFESAFVLYFERK